MTEEETPWVDRILARGRTTYPDADVSVDEIAASLRASVTDPPEPERDADLFLAHACAVGNSGAIRAFRGQFNGLVRTVFRDPGAAGVDDEDLEQLLLANLLTAPAGETPRISEYSGRGSLAGWVRVCATRLRIDAERKKANKLEALTTGQEHTRDLELLPGDPELEFLKDRYRADFRAAFGEALSELEPRERNLLRQTVVHELGATQLAALYGVDRSTTKRWLAKTRATLLQSTRARLALRLRINDDELESIMALIQSRLDVSVRVFLDASTQ